MEPYLVGIDGGGTKTKFVLANLSGKALSQVTYAQSNLTATGLGMAALNLREGVRQLLQNTPPAPIKVLVMALAGLDNNKERLSAREHLSQTLNTWQIEKLVVLNDTIAALRAGSDSSQAMVLIAGTGSNCFAINKQHYASVGGLDYLLSDEGSGYDAGRLCLRATAASLDGRTIASSLPQRVLNYFGAKNLRDLKKAVYNPSLSKSEIAALGKIVVEQMRTGDKLAKVIINNCLSQLLLYVQTTASKVKLAHKFDLVISGSFISNLADLFLPLLKKSFPHARIIVLKKNPAFGSLKIAQAIYQGASEEGFWFF